MQYIFRKPVQLVDGFKSSTFCQFFVTNFECIEEDFDLIIHKLEPAFALVLTRLAYIDKKTS